MARKLASGRRLKAVLVSGGLLAGAVVVGAAGPAHGVAQPAPSGFGAYANGTASHVHAVESDPTKLADVDHAFASVRVSADGLGDQPVNEMKEIFNAKLPDKNAYARGGGAEVGLGSPVPTDPSGKPLLLPAIAEAAAPTANPPYADLLKTAAPNQQQVIDLNGQLDPLANADALLGRAAALWNPNYLFPTLGNPLTYGYGEAADVQALDIGNGLDPQGRIINALVQTDRTGPSAGAVSAQSFSYLVNNGDGTCGIAQEVHQILAPVKIAGQLLIDVGGDWYMKSVTTGKPTGNFFTYGFVRDAQTPLISVSTIDATTGALTSQGSLSVQDIFGPAGLQIPANPIAEVVLGEPARAIASPSVNNGDPVYKSTPITPDKNGNGTDTAVAADAARVNVLSGASAGFQGADLRIGHFEMKAHVPSGGVNCEIPVRKELVGTATIGQPVNFQVKVPNDPAAVAPFPCDITNVSLTDKIEIPSGSKADMVLTGLTAPNNVKSAASGHNGGPITATVGWTNGQPSLVFGITGKVPSTAKPGLVTNTATATASANNCKGANSVLGNVIGLITGSKAVGNGTVTGADFFGVDGVGLTANISGGGAVHITGTGEARNIKVEASHVLAVTGRNDTMYLGLALMALASAFGVSRLRRRILAD